ncbi:hemolysin family protein [Petrimonas sp.]|uniref:hemolysin family protein n=1 Tax=Petrimonas sp. TaxID=2023866 RepID=UPI003F512618
MAFTSLLSWWFILLFLSAFFSGMEVAFVSSDKLRFAMIQKNKGFYNLMLNTIYSHPRQFLSTLLLGNLLVLVGFMYLSLLIAFPYIKQNITQNTFLTFLLIILGATVVILFSGEFFPRAVLARKPNFWVQVLLIPAFFFYILLFPVVKIFSSFSKIVLELFGVKSDGTNENALGRLELDSYVRKGFEEISDETEVDSEVKIFRNALDFSSMRVRDCMVPRADIVAINVDESIEKLKDLFIETGISRILVYGEDIDDIAGYIHVWEMFDVPPDWTKSIATVSFVPESMQANKLMNDLMQQRKSIAVVVDEFGGTSGVVTIEDLVEEIFGDIEDEYDSKSRFVKQESDNEYVLSGRVEIDTLNEDFGLDIPESESYSTVAGFLLHHTQRFPKTYETIIIDKYTFKILKVTARKIEVVRLIVDEIAN